MYCLSWSRLSLSTGQRSLSVSIQRRLCRGTAIKPGAKNGMPLLRDGEKQPEAHIPGPKGQQAAVQWPGQIWDDSVKTEGPGQVSGTQTCRWQSQGPCGPRGWPQTLPGGHIRGSQPLHSALTSFLAYYFLHPLPTSSPWDIYLTFSLTKEIIEKKVIFLFSSTLDRCHKKSRWGVGQRRISFRAKYRQL